MPDEILHRSANRRTLRHDVSIGPTTPFRESQLPGMVACRTLTDGRRMTNNTELVNEFIQQLFTTGDLDAVDRYLDPDFVNHDLPFPGAPDGPEGMRLAASTFRAALPDWHSEADQFISEGDLVVERFTASGTHTGAPLMGVPASGTTVTLAGINIFRMKGDRIVERWGRLDEAGLLRQLGLVP
jgi:predicted ester cyclase